MMCSLKLQSFEVEVPKNWLLIKKTRFSSYRNQKPYCFSA